MTSLLLFLSVATSLVFAKSPPNAETELSILIPEIDFEGYFSDDIRNNLINFANAAVQIVKAYPPSGLESNLTNWTGDKSIVKGKTVQLAFSRSDEKTLDRLRSTPGGIPKTVDSMSIAVANRKKKEMSIFIVFFVDRIFYDNPGKERTDGFSRLIVALAHHAYGDVQAYLEMPIDEVEAMNLAARQAVERRGYEASIRFLTEWMKNPVYTKIPAKIRNDLKKLLEDEKAAYQDLLKQSL